MSRSRQRTFRDDHDRLRMHARELIKLRWTLRRGPKKAHRIASNMIEEILQIHDAADLERLRPFMQYTREKLKAALGSKLARHMKGDSG